METFIMPVRGKKSYSIHSVENALDVLEALCAEEADVSLTRLSERLGMNKASVFRLLATFEGRGYVEHCVGSGKYRLSLAAFEVGQRLLSRMTLLRQAHPVMEQLVRECNEAAYLVVRRDREALFFDVVETSQQVKVFSLVGHRVQLELSPVGQIFLAYEALPSARLSASPSVADSLENIRAAGICVGATGIDESVTCAAVPLFSEKGVVVGSLALVWPEFRADAAQVESILLPALRRSGEIISSKMGYLGHYLGRDMTQQVN
ncbi:MAG: IclR family transcriptional regulator [Desulfuromonadales bacterium]|nr:IclR family transcriptional regulator [Desulfuromonadales bacterium]